MNNAFWFGVFPGMTEPARSEVAHVLRQYVGERTGR
jgi:hypothetical protein